MTDRQLQDVAGWDKMSNAEKQMAYSSLPPGAQAQNNAYQQLAHDSILKNTQCGQFTTKDSGSHETFTTGAQRDQRTGKGRYDLLPCAALRRLAQVYERGASKYAARNWERGMPTHLFMDSALRHTFQYLEGMRDEDHLGHAVFNLLALIDHEERIKKGELPETLLTLPPSKP